MIVISGLAGQHAVKDAVAFIRKPFDPDNMLEIIKKQLDAVFVESAVKSPPNIKP
jgi:DNA-binding NtrC family response regulator